MKSWLIASICVTTFFFMDAAVAALPTGWSKVQLDSDWLGPGNNPTDVCNGLARTKYGDRPFELISTSEEQRFRVPELRIDSQYKYHCVVLVGS